MAAPALIGMALGAADPRRITALKKLLTEVRAQRPDLSVEFTFLDQRQPWSEKLDRLVASGQEEAVLIPLDLAAGPVLTEAVEDAIDDASASHPSLRLRVADALGLHAPLLGVLDQRVREALRSTRALELDALVLAGSGSIDSLENQALARLARLWSARHRLPVTAAFTSSAPPSPGEAVRTFRSQGRRHIAVASLFLAPGPDADLAAELGREAGAIAVSEPLGAHPEVSRAVLARYAVGAVELVPV